MVIVAEMTSSSGREAVEEDRDRPENDFNTDSYVQNTLDIDARAMHFIAARDARDRTTHDRPRTMETVRQP
jgi:hypothetical protein